MMGAFMGGMHCGGHVWHLGGMHGREACMVEGVCVAGGVHGGGHVWQGGMHSRGHAWWGACVVGVVHGRRHAW